MLLPRRQITRRKLCFLLHMQIRRYFNKIYDNILKRSNKNEPQQKAERK